MRWNGRLIRIALLSYHILDKNARAFLKFVCTFSKKLRKKVHYISQISMQVNSKSPPNPNGFGGQVKFTQNYFAGLFFQ